MSKYLYETKNDRFPHLRQRTDEKWLLGKPSQALVTLTACFPHPEHAHSPAAQMQSPADPRQLHTVAMTFALPVASPQEQATPSTPTIQRDVYRPQASPHMHKWHL